MESRKRKAGEDVTEPAKRVLTGEQEADIPPTAGPTGTGVEGAAETDANMETDPATVATNTIDAAALPSGPEPIKTEEVTTENPPAAPADVTEGTAELDAASGLAVPPKVLSKPSTPAELAHFNQMLFDLMVRMSSDMLSPLFHCILLLFVIEENLFDTR